MYLESKVIRGSGSYLIIDGKHYLDASSGAMNVNFGHDFAPITRAIRSIDWRENPYLLRGHFESGSITTFESRVRESVGNPYTHVVQGVTGSDAIEQAYRIIFKYWSVKGESQRNIILSDSISYHGMTRWALDSSGHNPRRYGARGSTLSPSNVANVSASRPGERASVTEWENAIQLHGDELAAIVYEPVGGASNGAQCLSPEEIKKLAEMAHEKGIPIISDEVMCGFGRLGEISSGATFMNADIVVASKGLGAGYVPLSVVIVRDSIATYLDTNDPSLGTFGHTMSRQSASSTIGLAILEVLHDQSFVDKRFESLTRLSQNIDYLRSRHPNVIFTGRDFQRGLHWAGASDDQYNSARFIGLAFENGALFHEAGVDQFSDSVLIGPPINSTTRDIDRLTDCIDLTLTQMRKQEM